MSGEILINPLDRSDTSIGTDKKPAWGRGAWSQNEDALLLDVVQSQGVHNWVRISQSVDTRSPKQCRERYLQNLKPNLRHDPITPEEGAIIEDLVSQRGKRWAEIARRLPGRSSNAVKNWVNAKTKGRRRLAAQREERVRDEPCFIRSPPPLLSAPPDPLYNAIQFESNSTSSYDSGYASLDTSPDSYVKTRPDSIFDTTALKNFECPECMEVFTDQTFYLKHWKTHCGDESCTQKKQSQNQDVFSSRPTLRRLSSNGLRENGYANFEASLPGNSGVEEAVAHGPIFLQRDTHLDVEIGTPTQRNNISITTKKNNTYYSSPSDHSHTNSPDREHVSEARVESDPSDGTLSPSPENDAWLTVAYAKHRMMVSLMREVYTIFNSQWKADFRSRTGSRGASTGAYLQNSNSQTPSSAGRDKRGLHDRDSDPSDANDGKKRKLKSPKSREGGQERLFACPFYKYNAQKYCSNSDTGTKYRSCAGPGFSKISQVKQHLKRNHRAPIHCPRCWLLVESQAEMASHANADERCERVDPQAPEGVDQDKMRLITETWGVSWERIYEILFPGAPVPSSYYEADGLSSESFEPSSPQSRELRDFEIYNRTTLPLLVEANLRAIVDSQVAPIEDRVRAMVVDIVRTCQSTVARTFHLTLAPTSLANESLANSRMQSSSQAIASTETAVQTRGDPSQVAVNEHGDNSPDFFREPPHLNAEASASLPGPMYNHNNVTGNQSQSQDSGYGSFLDPCGCSCHDYSNTWNTANGRSSCQSCASRHSDLNDLDFELLYNGLDFG